MHKNPRAYLYLLPSFALILVFNYIPIVQAFARSFYDWRGGALATFVGLRNYKDLLGDSAFGVAVVTSSRSSCFTSSSS